MTAPATLRRTDFAGTTTSVELLVIGGGITGAAIAYEAASRGLSVALVERGDYGGATSSATGKLIHGGLRYLKRFDVGLVRESLAERRTLMTIAPNLVEPIAMVLPEPGLVERLGLAAYDLLSRDRNRIADPAKRIPRHRLLGAEQLERRGLGSLRSGALFHDAMMPAPERLTLAFLQSAAAHGALLANGVAVEELLGADGRVVGARVHDRESGRDGEIRATVTINATGPWARELLLSGAVSAPLAGPAPAVRSEGIYLVTRRLTETMVLTVAGHTHFSLAPWRGRTLIGPTETAFHGEASDWRLRRGSIEAFLAAINATSVVPVQLEFGDVLAAYGGLRPLTEQAGEDTYGASRAAELDDYAGRAVDGLMTAAGGKYTTSRAFAQHAVDRLKPRFGLRSAASRSAGTPLVGCDVGDWSAALAGATAGSGTAQAEPAELLLRLYGERAGDVAALADADPALAQRASADGIPLAAVAWSARHESPLHLTDLLLRRTGIANVGDPGEATLTAAAQVAAGELGWDAARTAAELTAARAAIALPTS